MYRMKRLSSVIEQPCQADALAPDVAAAKARNIAPRFGICSRGSSCTKKKKKIFNSLLWRYDRADVCNCLYNTCSTRGEIRGDAC